MTGMPKKIIKVKQKQPVVAHICVESTDETACNSNVCVESRGETACNSTCLCGIDRLCLQMEHL